METSPKLGRAVRFGTFELDLAAGELRKNGLKVRLQEQPFQLLIALVEKGGGRSSRGKMQELTELKEGITQTAKPPACSKA